MALLEQAPATATTPSIWRRIVVGSDGSEAGFEACRQAGRLAEPESSIDLVSVLDIGVVATTAFGALSIVEQLERVAKENLREGARILGRESRSRLVQGPPTETLLRELHCERATLIALGAPGHGRFAEIVLGGVAGEILHKAPCSVLVARPPLGERLFPYRLVVGYDGSASSQAALSVARRLGSRFTMPVRVVTASRGEHVDLARIRSLVPSVEVWDTSPVDALVDAAEDADLLVVGSRGLHGLRALGSVSERVVHRAASSVLVVRGARSNRLETRCRPRKLQRVLRFRSFRARAPAVPRGRPAVPA